MVTAEQDKVVGVTPNIETLSVKVAPPLQRAPVLIELAVAETVLYPALLNLTLAWLAPR